MPPFSPNPSAAPSEIHLIAVTIRTGHPILGDMPTPLESNSLMPTGTLLVLLAMSAVVVAPLVVWALIETIMRRQWGYLLGVVFLGPIGGLVWLVVGRRETARRSRGQDVSEKPATSVV
jgi:hypothetical protein